MRDMLISDENLLVKYSLKRVRQEAEDSLIREVINFTGPHQTRRASALMGLSYRRLLQKMKEYDIPLACSQCAQGRHYSGS